MKMNAKVLAWRLSLLLSAGSIMGVALATHQTRPPYDMKESIAKLTQIGKSLQVYRKYHPAKPVAERKTYEDAGLPNRLTALAEPGHPWSLPDGLATFHVSNPNEINVKNYVSFSHMYWTPTASLHLPDMSAYYVSRGEKMPVLADDNPNSLVDMGPGRVQTALVLRLNGDVEVIHYSLSDMFCVLKQ